MRRLPDAEFFVPDPLKRRKRDDDILAQADATHHILVVTHGKCLDGIGSYLMHALALESPPPVVYAHPNEVHEVLAVIARRAGDGRTVSINDLSFDRDHLDDLEHALAELTSNGWSIVWRDHHHTQWEDIDTDRIERHLTHFRLDREKKECGASLVQQDLLPEDPLARALADIVRDRDLWHNKDPRSARYEAAAAQLGAESFVDRFLATRDVDAPWIERAAQEAQRKTDQEVEAAVLSAEVFGPDDEVGVIYGDVPKNVTLHTLRERRGTRLEINLKPDGSFSIRSAPGTDVAHLLGQAYGGGGHPNAAGGKARVPAWEWPAYWLQGGLSPAGKSVIKTALRLIAKHDERNGKGKADPGAEAVQDQAPKPTRTKAKATKKTGKTQGSNGNGATHDTAKPAAQTVAVPTDGQTGPPTRVPQNATTQKAAPDRRALG